MTQMQMPVTHHHAVSSNTLLPTRNKLTYWLKRPDIRLSLGFSLVFLVCYGLTAIFISYLYLQQTETTLQEYGNTVARQLALSTKDAVIRGDLISLHAQLEDLTKVPTLPEAAVYDMENNVLAQSIHDQRTGNPTNIYHFSAIITFQDSIAGKVIIGLDAAELLKNKHWLSGYFLCGLVLAAFLIVLMSKYFLSKSSSLYRALLEQIHSIQPNITEGFSLNENSPLPSLKQTFKQLNQLQEYVAQLEQGAPVLRFSQTGKLSPTTPTGSYAELLIYCENFSTLQQQIHHRELNRLLEEFHFHTQQVTTLYAAENINIPGNQILLRFHHDDITDAALQAVCCAVVLRSLTKPPENEPVFLEVRFAIHWHEHDERKIPDLLRNHLLAQEQKELLLMCDQAKTGNIIVSKGIKRSKGIAEQVKLELISGDSENELYRVQKLSDSYKKLLEQQVQQLVDTQSIPTAE